MNLRPLDPMNLAQPDPQKPGIVGRVLLIAVCFLATAIASTLTFLKFTGRISDLAGCSGGGGCNEILSGRWANWLLLPVSFWALLVYLPLLGLAFAGLTTPARRRLAFVATAVLVAAAGWFLGIQLFVEQKLCKWCCTMHVCGVIAFCYSTIRIFKCGDPLKPVIAAGMAATALSMTALVGGQVFGPQPASHEITEDDLLVDFDEGEADGPTTGSTFDLADANSPPEQSPPANSNSGSSNSGSSNAGNSDNGDTESAATGATGPDSGSDTGADAENNSSDAAADLPVSPSVPNRLTTSGSDTPPNTRLNATGIATGTREQTSPDILRPPADPIDDLVATDATSPVEQAVPTTAVGASLLPATHQGLPFASPFPKPGDATDGVVAEFFGGGIRLQLEVVPHIGSTSAKYRLLKYFDYTCPACSKMHEDLIALQEKHPNTITVMVIPCPLYHRCNPHIETRDSGETLHAHACQLAGYALAVWRADPQSFESFHNQLFERQGRVTPKSARIIAASLVGEQALEEAMRDPYIAQMIKHSTTVYSQLKKKSPRMPKLLLGGRQVLHGVATDTSAFIKAVEDTIELK